MGSVDIISLSAGLWADVLRDRQAPRPDRIEALKFLVHFVGDVHQPLHAGYGVDRGGNDIKVWFYGDNTNLHSLWDYRSGMKVYHPDMLASKDLSPELVKLSASKLQSIRAAYERLKKSR